MPRFTIGPAPRRLKTGGLTLVEGLLIIVVVLMLGSLFIHVFDGSEIRAAKITRCTSNLKNIGAIAEVYRKTFGGETCLLPTEMGEAWLVKLIDTVCENKDNSIFRCPCSDNTGPTGTDYRGPSLDVNKNSEYPKLTLPLVADKCPGGKTQHFGDNKKYGVNAIGRGYQVTTSREGDPNWPDFGPDSPYLKD